MNDIPFTHGADVDLKTPTLLHAHLNTPLSHAIELTRKEPLVVKLELTRLLATF